MLSTIISCVVLYVWQHGVPEAALDHRVRAELVRRVAADRRRLLVVARRRSLCLADHSLKHRAHSECR